MPVIDTGVIIAVLLDEPAAEAAAAEMAKWAGYLHAPDILAIELANALVNAVRAKRTDADTANRVYAFAAAIPIVRHPTEPLVARGLDIALTHQRRPFDGVFVALAEQRDDVLLTMDGKLKRGLRGTPLDQRVRLIPG